MTAKRDEFLQVDEHGDPYIEIGGVKAFVRSDEECEQADFVVCAPASTDSPFPDNVHTVYAICGAAIIHRPTAPSRPPKVCLACAARRIAQSEAES
jgi:hypothetical protein